MFNEEEEVLRKVIMETYTPEEVAKLFKISKHTVYELVKRGELQAFRVGNKMRINADELERFKENGQSNDSTKSTPVHTLSLAGSHDFFIESLMKYIGQQADFLSIQPSYIGSLEGLMTLYRGGCDLAAVHLLDPTTKQYNLPFIKQLFVHEPLTVIRLAVREQGFIVQKGNPKNVQSINDLTRRDCLFINRQRGSGTRFLFDSLLAEANVSPTHIQGYGDEEWTHLNVAVKIQQGLADVGLGIRSAASKLGLDFVPVTMEPFDLVLRWTDKNQKALEHLLDLIHFTDIKEYANELEGYDTSEWGQIIYSTFGGK